MIHIVTTLIEGKEYGKYKIFTIFGLYILFVKYERTISVPKKMEYDNYFIKWVDKENEKYEKFYQCYRNELFIFKLGLYTNNNYWKNDYTICALFTPLGYFVYIIILIVSKIYHITKEKFVWKL